MEQSLIDRINFLARESKVRELTEAEKAEQQELRAQYIKDYRKSLRGILDNTYIVRPDGTKEKLKSGK